MNDFIKKWESAKAKADYVLHQSGSASQTHGVNDPNLSHYLKSETYNKSEVNGFLALKENLITPGTTEQYLRGDKTFQILNTSVVPEGVNLYHTTTRVRNAISTVNPIAYDSATGVIGLNINLTNLRIKNNDLDTIQDIALTSVPMFAGISISNTTAITSSLNDNGVLTLGVKGSIDGVITLNSSQSSGTRYATIKVVPSTTTIPGYGTGQAFVIGQGSGLDTVIAPVYRSFWLCAGGAWSSGITMGTQATMTQTGGLQFLDIVPAISNNAGVARGIHLHPQWAQTGTATAIDFLINSSGTYGSGGHLLIDAQQASVSMFNVSASGQAYLKDRLGIGITSASSPLHVVCNATSGEGIRVQRSTNPAQYISLSESDGSCHLLEGFGDKVIRFKNYSTSYGYEFMTSTNNFAIKIDVNGKIGLTVSTPEERLHIDGNLKIRGNSGIFDQTFSTGWLGTGYRLDYGLSTANSSTLEIDNATIRGTLRVFELLIQQIRATNGSLFISSAAKVKYVSGTAPNETITFDDPSNHNVCPFMTGDIIMSQRVNLNSTFVVSRHYRKVVSVNGASVTVTSVTGAPADVVTIKPGFDFVRIYNETNEARRGTIYLTSDDTTAPYMDVMDGVSNWTEWNDKNKLKLRAGKLSGIISSTYGTLSGYGLYTSNIFLEGNAQIRGTLTAGDASGAGNTFYAGRIKRNLLKWSNGTYTFGQSGTPYYHWTDGTCAQSSENGILPDGTAGTYQTLRNTSGQTFFILGSDSTRAVTGDQRNRTYTVSFWAKTSPYEAGTQLAGTYTVNWDFPINVSLNKPWQIILTDKWQRFSNTVTLPSTGTSTDSTRIHFMIPVTDQHLCVWGAQFEEGYSPSAYQATDGILSSDSGFGMWALRGGFGGSIQNPRIALSNEGLVVRSSSSAASSWLASDTISIGYNGSTWGIIGKSGGTNIFELGSTNQIAGWSFSSDSIYNNDNYYSVVLNNGGHCPFIYTGYGLGVGTDDLGTILGKIPDRINSAYTDEIGLINYDNYNGGKVFFVLTNNTRKIANWDFDDKAFFSIEKGSGIALNTDSSPLITKGFEVYDTNSPKLFIGDTRGQSLDWNITTPDVLTIKGELLASRLSTVADYGGTYTGAMIYDSTIRSQFVNASTILSCKMMDGHIEIYQNQSGIVNNVYIDGNGLKINGFVNARWRGSFSGGGVPTNDLRDGDIIFNTSLGQIKIYASGAWR